MAAHVAVGLEHRSAPALLLDFAPPGAPLEPRPPAGSAVDAELAFYPGATPLRALRRRRDQRARRRAGRVRHRRRSRRRSRARPRRIAANPWLDEWPVALAAAVPDGRTTVDARAPGRLAAARRRRARRWRLLALSGGRPVSVFGLWNGDALTPLAAGDGDADGAAVTLGRTLVAAALIGTDRRPVGRGGAARARPRGSEAALAERGAEDRLLASAAAWTVARRAGARAGERGRRSTPAERRSAAAVLPGRRRAAAGAARGRASACSCPSGSSSPRGAGVRPPPELLPDLLDHAARDADLHGLVGAAAGPLGRWLAEREPRWAFVRGAADDVDAVWAGGGRAGAARAARAAAPHRPGARRASCSRARSPRRPGRTARRSSPRSTIGLSDADEPFLEAALDDSRASRSATRPRAAARALPRSRFAARMAERADAAAARRGRHASSSRCPARRTRPRSATASARAAGARSASTALLAATPLATWRRARPELGRCPSPTTSRPLSTRAGRRPRDASTTPRGRARCGRSRRPRLLAALPRAEAEALAAAAATRVAAARRCAGPWGPELSRAVIAAIRRPARRATRGVDVAFAGYRLDPALAPEAEPLRDLGGRDLWSCATCSPSGLPCCGSCRDRRDATPPAPRRAALRRRAHGARARRRPARARPSGGSRRGR